MTCQKSHDYLMWPRAALRHQGTTLCVRCGTQRTAVASGFEEMNGNMGVHITEAVNGSWTL